MVFRQQTDCLFLGMKTRGNVKIKFAESESTGKVACCTVTQPTLAEGGDNIV